MTGQTATLSATGTFGHYRRVSGNAVAFRLLLLSAAGWMVLGYLSTSGDGLALCLSAPATLIDGFLSGLSAQMFAISPALLVGEWVLMILAMMVPLAVPHLTIFCARLYRPMQRPALAAALAGFLLVWGAVGIVVIPLMVALRAVAIIEGFAWVVPLLAYGAAIWWSYAPARLWAYRRCHVVPVVYGKGRDVYWAAFAYGLRLGGWCSLTCGLAMAAPMLSGQGILAMALVTHVLLKERLSYRVTPAQTAVPLVLIGVMTAF